MEKRKHIVALSGGKDSTAMAVLLNEREPRDYTYVCTPTGDELPEMIDHWLKLGKILGKKILPVTSGRGLNAEIKKQNCLPNNRMRWCTRILKIEPFQRFMSENAPSVSYVGLRADEGLREGMAFSEGAGIEIRFPLREWGMTESDVWEVLDSRGVKIPARTDCARCYHQTLGEWFRLWFDHPTTYADAERQEAEIGHTFRNKSRDTWPAALSELRTKFEAGHIPPRTVHTDDLFQGGRRGVCRVCSL